VAEVYTLNALFLAAALFALLVWADGHDGPGRERSLLLAAFLTGLAVTAHMTSALLVPVALLFVLLADRGIVRRRRQLLLRALGAGWLGLTPYLYLPLRAAMDPPMNYGDATTLGGLFDILSGGVFREQMFAFGPAELPGRVGMYLGLLLEQYPPALLAAAAAGAAALLFGDRTDRAFMGLLGAFGLGGLAYALEYDIKDIEAYFVPSYLILALLAARGLPALALVAARPFSSGENGIRPARTGLAMGIPALALALALLPVRETSAAVDQSQNYSGRAVAETVAAKTVPGASVVGGRELAAVYYMQFVEGRRRDLRPVNVNARNARYFVEKALERGPTYCVNPVPAVAEAIQDDGRTLSRVEGQLYRVVPPDG
jgi:4-amino-4-deoxy-L-arabinose transferase-like glycosyltransferase